MGVVIMPRPPVELYRFEESTAGDTTGVNGTVLVATGPPTINTSGKHGRCRTYTRASGQSFSLAAASATAYNPSGSGFTVAAWVKHATLSTNEFCIAGKTGLGAADRGWQFYRRGAANGPYRMAVSTAGTAATLITAEDVTNYPTTGVWYFVAGGVDLVRGYVFLRVNDYARNEVAYSIKTVAASPRDFNVGSYNDAATSRWDGQIDSLYYFDYPLTDHEIDWLYDGGRGTDYLPVTLSTAAATVIS